MIHNETLLSISREKDIFRRCSGYLRESFSGEGKRIATNLQGLREKMIGKTPWLKMESRKRCLTSLCKVSRIKLSGFTTKEWQNDERISCLPTFLGYVTVAVKLSEDS